LPVHVRYFTDPACSRSWGTEPAVRRLMVEFGDELRWTWVMGGLARELSPPFEALVMEWLEVAWATGMPLDPLVWKEGPIASSYPAAMAVKAAAEQAPDGGYAYLRRLREGILCLRRKLDTTEALVEEARAAGLDVERFRIDLGSHAIVEAFGADLEEARGLELPSASFAPGGGEARWLHGPHPPEAWVEAAEAAGAERAGGEPPGVLEAIGRFGRMAPRELEVVCDLPEPRVHAELWRLAGEWRVKPVRVLTGRLWEAV
jgi:putative protein-disulfide isomerase